MNFDLLSRSQSDANLCKHSGRLPALWQLAKLHKFGSVYCHCLAVTRVAAVARILGAGEFSSLVTRLVIRTDYEGLHGVGPRSW